MVGRVFRVNWKVGLVIVHMEDDTYSGFEITGKARPGLNDRIRFEPDTPGAVRNQTQGESYAVLTPDHGFTKRDALQVAMLD